MRAQKTLTLFCSNVRGLVCNWHNATSFDWNPYDLVAFNEVWSIKEYENLIVDGFEVKAVKLREATRGGGTIIFGKKDLITTVINSPFIEGCIETTGIKINDLVFLNVYRPPNGNKETFVDTLTQFLDTTRNQKIVIGGDFNLNMLASNNWINAICNLYQLTPKIREVTRIVSGTCIDNFLSNVDGEFKVSEISIADHQALTAKILCDPQSKKQDDKFFYRVMKDSNWMLFNHHTHNLTIRGTDIEDKWSNLLSDIKILVDESFPIRESKKRYLFTMSSGLLKSRDRKNKLLRQYKRGAIAKEVYINYNRIYRKLIKTEQCSVFKENLIKAGDNGKKKWSVIKSSLFLQTESKKILEVNSAGTSVKSDIEIAKTFKTHFETCASKLAEGLPIGQDTATIIPKGAKWGFKHTTEVEVVKIIKSLMNKNSSGYDTLSNKMLKKEPYVFARLLKPLINESLDVGIFPSCLKTANVIPIHKKGDPTNLNNYRPISLLPVISKVFEKILNAQLTAVIDNGFIDENQFGFRINHSTEDAVIKFVDQIERDLAMGNHVVSIYIDWEDRLGRDWY